MTDLDDLRQVLREREALAPDLTGIAAGARARGLRIRRTRTVGAVAAAVVTLLLGAAVVGRPQAGRDLPGTGVNGTGVTFSAAVTGGWPVVPSYSVPAVPGQPEVPGPTGGAAQPASRRPIDPVVPYTVTLPAGWRESGWQYQEGSFRGTYTSGSGDIIALDVLDPATQPASLLHPSGDPATGRPGPDGALAWRADTRHFVRIQERDGPNQAVFRAIADSFDFSRQRAMTSPFSLAHLPAGLHLSGVDVRTSASPANNPADGAWGVQLSFDIGTGPVNGTDKPHDLVIDFEGEPDPSSYPALENPVTVAGHQASYVLTPAGVATLNVYGVQGQNLLLIIGAPALDRITLDEDARIISGVQFVPRPADTTTWTPLRLP